MESNSTFRQMPAFGDATGMQPDRDPFQEEVHRGVGAGSGPIKLQNRSQWYEQAAPVQAVASKLQSALSDTHGPVKDAGSFPLQAASFVVVEELEPAPIFLEPRTHFTVASPPSDVWAHITAFVDRHGDIDLQVGRSYQGHGVAKVDGNIITFCVSLYRPTTGAGSLIEYQRRSGCSISSCSLFRALRGAVEQSLPPAVNTVPSESSPTSSVPSDLAVNADVDCALTLQPLLRMLCSKTLEAKTEAFCSLAGLVRDPLKGDDLIDALFTINVNELQQGSSLDSTLDLTTAALSSPDPTLCTYASSLLLACVSRPQVAELAVNSSSTVTALADILSQPDHLLLRASKRNAVRTLLSLASLPATLPLLTKSLTQSRPVVYKHIAALAAGGSVCESHSCLAEDSQRLMQLLA